MAQFAFDKLSQGTLSSNKSIFRMACLLVVAILAVVCLRYSFNSENISSQKTPGSSFSNSWSWRVPALHTFPECKDIDVSSRENVIYSFLRSMPGTRKEIVHFDFKMIKDHDSVFDMVVPAVKKEQGQNTYDWIADVLSQGQLWEYQETLFISKRLDECRQKYPGDIDRCTFLDIGANIGWYATVIASQGYRVVAFEANPMLYSVLYNTIMLPTNKVVEGSKVADIKLVPYGLGEKFEKCQIYSQGGNFYGSSTLKCGDVKDDNLKAAGYEPRGDVLISPADCWLTDIKNVHVMKIDVEGFEIMVMRGMHRMLEHRPPTYIFAEFQSMHQKRQGLSGVKLLEFLSNIGYSCYLLQVDIDKREPMMPFAIEDDKLTHTPDRNMLCERKVASAALR